MKIINVVAAVIKKDNLVLTTQRGYGEFKGLWEFPGGKIEKGESHQQALVREIKEELNVNISVEDFICTVEYEYPNFYLVMHTYFGKITQGEVKLIEHQSMKWVEISELDNLNWLKADIDIIIKLKEIYGKE